jgi:hypothetical protein
MNQENISVSNDRYVYYDESGEITSISNTNDNNGNYITLSLDQVSNFLIGKESTSSYLVIYDTFIKQNVLRLKYQADDSIFNINDSIFKVELLTDQKPDFIITQDIVQKEWVFKIDQGLKNYLLSQKSFYNKNLYFSITRKNDPHELYRLITVNFADLVENDSIKVSFKHQFEQSANNLSVYTTKRFETYSYEVIND